jgi:methyl-accepting chemotaxis protein
MAKKKKRRNSLSKLLKDIVDDTKDYVDDITDRARDVEDDLRTAMTDGLGNGKKKKSKKKNKKRRKQLAASVLSMNQAVEQLSKQAAQTNEAATRAKAAAS